MASKVSNRTVLSSICLPLVLVLGALGGCIPHHEDFAQESDLLQHLPGDAGAKDSAKTGISDLADKDTLANSDSEGKFDVETPDVRGGEAPDTGDAHETSDAALLQCGDGECGLTESCATCPVDCSPCCGDFDCQKAVLETPCSCPQDCGFPCKDKQCGEDGCGGTCGTCEAENYCTSNGVCDQCPSNCETVECGQSPCGEWCGGCAGGLVCEEGECRPPCFPVCQGKECGPDFCGAKCGDCPPSKSACSELLGFVCVEKSNCAPVCMGKECGDDGCGGNCGQCPGDWYCQSGMCVPSCTPQCLVPPDFMAYKQCGWDECPGTGVCGVCPQGFYCAPGYMFVECSCLGKECGEDGCGVGCGDCPPGWDCDLETVNDPEVYVCEPCTPDCTNKECGDNGCGGMCGICPIGFDCINGLCEKECNPVAGCFGKECGPNGCPYGCMEQGTQECSALGPCPQGTQCDPGSNMCVPCTGSCGECAEYEYCSADYICLKQPGM